MTGRTISHYRILEKLGEGGMGVVYKAEDTKLRRMVALKFLSEKALESEKLKARFFREAQAAGALDHPNICAVHGIEEVEGQVFIIMAFVPGKSLHDIVKPAGISLGRALDIAVQIGQGLKEAHEKGIVHRDIKSGNVLITPKWEAKITDFGLALLADRSRITKTGTTLGTIAYMSPEQALGKTVDRRTDIWSLGVVVYESVTGRFPFSGGSAEAVCRSILGRDPRPVTELRGGLPVEVCWVLGKALAKKTEERYQHIDDMLVDLRSLLRKQPAEREEEPDRTPPVTVSTTAPTVTIYDGSTVTLHTGLTGERDQGQRLDEMIPPNGMSIEEALRWAARIAGALAAAHSEGRFYRGLRPSDIMVTPEGKVALTERARAASAPSSGSAAVASVSYLSPEQLRGVSTDERSDIFSFGTILYEMLTGRRAFGGAGMVAVQSAILGEDATALGELVGSIPRELEWVVARCLKKDPDRRWQAMADVRIAMEELEEQFKGGALAIPKPREEKTDRRWEIGLALFAALVVIVIALVWWRSLSP